jgi:hypothetical protein
VLVLRIGRQMERLPERVVTDVVMGGESRKHVNPTQDRAAAARAEIKENRLAQRRRTAVAPSTFF